MFARFVDCNTGEIWDQELPGASGTVQPGDDLMFGLIRYRVHDVQFDDRVGWTILVYYI